MDLRPIPLQTWGKYEHPISYPEKTIFTDEELRNLENTILESYSFCDVSSEERERFEKDTGLHKFQLNKPNFLALIRASRDNADLQRKIACLMEGTFTMSDQLIALNSFFDVYQRIPTEPDTNVNIAFIDAQGNTPAMIVKSQKYRPEIEHEALIGMVAVNELTTTCSNFVYTFGFVDCFAKAENGHITCADPDNSSWKSILIEYVPGTSLKELINSLTPTEYLEILLQVESALHYAYTQCQFTHYDLHDGNVMVEILEEPRHIPLFFGTQPQTILTKYVARIIDYGMSFAQINGIGFGSTKNIDGRDKLYLFRDRPYPLYDTYKLLCHSGLRMYKMSKEQRDVFRPFLSACFAYFGDLTDRLKLRSDNLKEWDAARRRQQKATLTEYCQCDDRFLDGTHENYIDFLLNTISLVDELVIVPFAEDLRQEQNWSEIIDTVYDSHQMIKTSKEYYEAQRFTPDQQWLMDHTDGNYIAEREGPEIIRLSANYVENLQDMDTTLYYSKVVNFAASVEKWLTIVPFDNEKVMEVEDAYNQIITSLREWEERRKQKERDAQERARIEMEKFRQQYYTRLHTEKENSSSL